MIWGSAKLAIRGVWGRVVVSVGKLGGEFGICLCDDDGKQWNRDLAELSI